MDKKGKSPNEFLKSLTYVFSHKHTADSFSQEQTREIKNTLSQRNGRIITSISLIVFVHQVFCVISDMVTGFYQKFAPASFFNMAAEALMIFTTLLSFLAVNIFLHKKNFRGIEVYQWIFNFLMLIGFLLYICSDFMRGVTSTSVFFVALIFGFGTIYTIAQIWTFFALYFFAVLFMDIFVPTLEGVVPIDNLQSMLVLAITPFAALFSASSFWKSARTEYDLKEANLLLEKVSNTDWLTDLPNRRSLYSYVEQNIDNWKKEGRYIAVAVADIDDFKAYNDTFTHIKGDECLVQVAKCFNNFCKRNGGISARTGGEEFCFICININDKDFVEKKMQELLDEIKTLNLPSGKGAAHSGLTVSIGVSISKADKNYSFEGHYTKADNNLYEAKSKGKNTFEVSG